MENEKQDQNNECGDRLLDVPEPIIIDSSDDSNDSHSEDPVAPTTIVISSSESSRDGCEEAKNVPTQSPLEILQAIINSHQYCHHLLTYDSDDIAVKKEFVCFKPTDDALTIYQVIKTDLKRKPPQPEFGEPSSRSYEEDLENSQKRRRNQDEESDDATES